MSEGTAKASESGIDDHRFSGRIDAGNAATWRLALNGPMTAGQRAL
jgi:hypothetical protein